PSQNFTVVICVVIASLASLCTADVSHLGLSRTYLPPSTGYSSSSYSSYPSSYTGSAYSSGAGGYYAGSGTGYNTAGYGSGYNTAYNSGYGSGYGSAYNSGSGYSSGYPQVRSGYTSYASVPQYRTYATPSRTYLPAVTTGYSGLDTKYGSNGGYIY
ncbi:hypothetical protein KR222_007432, partial [Zaprionus bogoriensis]